MAPKEKALRTGRPTMLDFQWKAPEIKAGFRWSGKQLCVAQPDIPLRRYRPLAQYPDANHQKRRPGLRQSLRPVDLARAGPGAVADLGQSSPLDAAFGRNLGSGRPRRPRCLEPAGPLGWRPGSVPCPRSFSGTAAADFTISKGCRSGIGEMVPASRGRPASENPGRLAGPYPSRRSWRSSPLVFAGASRPGTAGPRSLSDDLGSGQPLAGVATDAGRLDYGHLSPTGAGDHRTAETLPLPGLRPGLRAGSGTEQGEQDDLFGGLPAAPASRTVHADPGASCPGPPRECDRRRNWGLIGRG
jgi:hypothetical protein